MNTIAIAIIAAIKAVGKVFGITALGYLLAHKGFLPSTTCKAISQLIHILFLPALMISNVAPIFEPGMLDDVWPLLLWSLIAQLIAFAIGSLTRWIVNPEKRIFRPYLCCTIYQSTTTLPLLIIHSLSTTLDAFSEDPKKYEQTAVLYINIFGLIWYISYYAIGYPYLHKLKPTTEEFPLTSTVSDSTSEYPKKELMERLLPSDEKNGKNYLPWSKDFFGNSSDYSRFVSINKEGVLGRRTVSEAYTTYTRRPRHWMAFSGDIQLPPNAAMDWLARPKRKSAEPQPLIDSNDASSASVSRLENYFSPRYVEFFLVIKRILTNPTIFALIIALLIAIADPFRDLIFTGELAFVGEIITMCGSPYSLLATFVTAASFSHAKTIPEQSFKLTNKTVSSAVICRLVVIPTFSFAVVILLTYYPWGETMQLVVDAIFPNNILFRLIVCLEFAGTSSNLISSTLNQIGLHEENLAMATILQWQTILSFGTLCVWVTLAIAITQDSPVRN